MTQPGTVRGAGIPMPRTIGRTSVLVLAAALALAACGGLSGPTLPAEVTPSPGGTNVPPTGAGPGSGVPSGAALLVDEGLLRYLPNRVEDFPVEFAREAAESVAGDPTLAQNALSIAYGIAADPAGTDWVVAAVAQIREGVFSDEWFRDWRTTYDEAACAQAGGVGGHAEAEIGGRTVHIGTCNGGSHTYHVFLAGERVMVSATSVGSARFGERLVGNLGG